MAQVYRIIQQPVSLKDKLARRWSVLSEIEGISSTRGPVRPEEIDLRQELDELDAWICEYCERFPGALENVAPKPPRRRRWVREVS